MDLVVNDSAAMKPDLPATMEPSPWLSMPRSIVVEGHRDLRNSRDESTRCSTHLWLIEHGFGSGTLYLTIHNCR
jgi:hypothetical protein